MTAEREQDEETRTAEIAGDLERAVRAEGVRHLVRVVADLTAKLERIGEQLSNDDERLKSLEVAADALSIPLVRGSVQTVELPVSATVSADMPLTEAEGFHRIEYATTGDVYRWTGANGEQFGFVLMVDRSQEMLAELVLWPRGPGMTPVPAVLHCAVDGQPHRATASGRESGTYELRLPVREGGAFTQLHFVTPVGAPDHEGDDRILGVPFRYLTVRPAVDA